MKQLLLILTLAITLASCSNEEVCPCEKVVTYYTIASNEVNIKFNQTITRTPYCDSSFQDSGVEIELVETFYEDDPNITDVMIYNYTIWNIECN